ncbi:unnamed protein product [Cladocopium goreaui]|uniref:3'-phosphate/5'-hydroxy nucleic acid ligase n=1 Tax=Cladocopium goreaui TaxID=2562237 RepID=A0A9P1BPG1_9DINO|nr:unnamed protein product [Cladocopium goreaui]
MPDVHMGKGVAIGAVFASEKYVCPNAVGVDIGCGMCAVPIEGLYKDDLSDEDLHRLQSLIKARIPTSFDSHDAQLPWAKETLKDITREHHPTDYLAKRIEKEPKIGLQLGTLGGGNHFLEVVYSEGDGQVWCMLHSGSRNVGNTTASFYDRVAGERGVALRGLHGSLNYLDVESKDGRSYLKDMQWCQAYARENRRSMLELMIATIEEVTGKKADLSRAVNAHHNFCQCEKCSFYDSRSQQVQEKTLWVTRKGATSAREGEYGIIPGSMGVGSYIVKGRGARGSWQSCSHGAGRTMSRTAAKKVIAQEAFEASMKGIVCDTHPAVRDEAPQAYKDLGQVLKNQADLVEVEYRLLPLVNVKGFEEKSCRPLDGLGQRSADQGRSTELVEVVMSIADMKLKVGGSMVAKHFEGASTTDLIGKMKARFEQCRIIKTRASRIQSCELYLCCLGKKPINMEAPATWKAPQRTRRTPKKPVPRTFNGW